MGDIYRRSVLLRLTADASAGSVLLDRARGLPDRTRRTPACAKDAIASSRLADVARDLAGAANESTLTHLVRGTNSVIRASFCYRWLTAETEPEVVIIDLRGTFSIGPTITALNWLAHLAVPASHRSVVVNATETTHEYARGAPVRAASLVFLAVVLASLGFTFALSVHTQTSVLAHLVLLGLAALGTRVRLSWPELIETKPVHLFITALEPPTAPEDWEE